jgi:hypothetical protein
VRSGSSIEGSLARTNIDIYELVSSQIIPFIKISDLIDKGVLLGRYSTCYKRLSDDPYLQTPSEAIELLTIEGTFRTERPPEPKAP